MRQRRDEAFRLVMTALEKAALEHLAERDGGSQAAIIRRLVRREAERHNLWSGPPPQTQTEEARA